MNSDPYYKHDKSVPCELCGRLTTMTGTKLCDRCWELKHRIECDPHTACKIGVPAKLLEALEEYVYKYKIPDEDKCLKEIKHFVETEDKAKKAISLAKGTP